MSLHVLCQGTLAADPQERTSAAGKAYCTGLMRIPIDGSEAVLASLIVFDTAAVKALIGLHKGDPLAVAGSGKLTVWKGKDGLEHHGLDITGTAVLSVYEARKRSRKAAEEAEFGGQA